MTLAKLIKALQTLADMHGGSVPVCANAQEMLDSCNGVWGVIDVRFADVDLVRQVDGDGFSTINKDGSERYRKCVVLTHYQKESAPS